MWASAIVKGQIAADASAGAGNALRRPLFRQDPLELVSTQNPFGPVSLQGAHSLLSIEGRGSRSRPHQGDASSLQHCRPRRIVSRTSRRHPKRCFIKWCQPPCDAFGSGWAVARTGPLPSERILTRRASPASTTRQTSPTNRGFVARIGETSPAWLCEA